MGKIFWPSEAESTTRPPENCQNIVSAMWRKHVGRATRKHEFGLISGMVEQWGNQAPQVFKAMLGHWPVFMACAKGYFTEAYLDKQGFPTRHYRYASLDVLRRFAFVAPEVYTGLKQGWLDADAKAACPFASWLTDESI